MAELTLNQIKFWSPNANEFEQNPQILLRADNLTFEEDGVVKTTRGAAYISSGAFGTAPNALYSQSLLGSTVGSSTPTIKVRYVSSNGSVYRNYTGASPTETDFSGALLTGGDSGYSAFGNAWGHTFVFSGTKKRADKGDDSSWRDLGIAAATAPTVARTTPPSIDVFSTWAPWTPAPEWFCPEGSLTVDTGNTWIKTAVDTTTKRGILACPYYGVSETIDLTNFGSTGQDTPNDIWSMGVRVDDTASLIKVRIEFILEKEGVTGTPPGALGTAVDVKNYYWFEWINDAKLNEQPDLYTPDIFDYQDKAEFIEKVKASLGEGVVVDSFFRDGSDFWGSLQCRRSQFKRSGTDAAKDWKTVYGIRIIVESTESTNGLTIGYPGFIGGENGQLSGYYSYVQVNVIETGDYTEVGLASTAASEIQVINGSVTVTPSTPPAACNRVRIYRSSTNTPGYYLVKEVATPYAAFTDTYSDIDAVRDGVGLENFRAALPSGIRQVVMPYYDRAIYFDYNTCYPSFIYDPGSYDSRHEFRICGTDSEIILWATKVIDGVILVGTTNDIYSLSGDFGYEQDTGLLNISVESLGIKQPPVSAAVCVWSNNLIYLAEDGWRSLAGSQTQTVIDQIDLLYRKTARHGLGYAVTGSRNSDVSVCVVSGNKLYTAITDSVNGRVMHIYDFIRKQWNYWRDVADGNDTPLTLFVEEDGTIIYSTGSAGDKYLSSFDVAGTENILGSGAKNTFLLRTPYLCAQQPNRRKDPFTLRIKADSNNENVTVTIRGKGDGAASTLNFTQAFNGLVNVYLSIASGLAVPKYFQVEITGATTRFVLHDIEIIFESRPEQLNYLLLSPETYGTDSRKRIPAIPLVIDTLSNNVTFTPIIDNVPQTAATINTAYKSSYIYQFITDKTGRTIGGTLSCSTGVFEFYELQKPQEVEVLPEAIKYKYITANNLGTGKRKRFHQIAFVINTKGTSVAFTPLIDGVAKTAYNYTTTDKATVVYTFDTETTGIEIAASLVATNEFEYYGLSPEDSVYEALPPVTKFFRLASTNFNTTRRKRFQQIGYVIDPLGGTITFTPYVDGVASNTSTCTGTGKQTVIHTFSSETTGIDFGGTLASTTNFEFYELSLADSVYETLPPVTKFYRLQDSNFGSPTKKRIRTLAFSINTKGNIVTFTPRVDGVNQPITLFNTAEKRTVLHYFNSDVFGIDFGGTFSSDGEFEFYQQLQPFNVETLPIGRLWDQIGPIDFNRQAKVKMLRLTLLPEGTEIDYTIYSSDVVVTTGTILVTANIEQTVEVMMPAGIEVGLFRVEFTSTSIFHRIKAEFKLSITGKDTEQRWISV
jgi:hypothetical protein